MKDWPLALEKALTKIDIIKYIESCILKKNELFKIIYISYEIWFYLKVASSIIQNFNYLYRNLLITNLFYLIWFRFISNYNTSCLTIFKFINYIN